MAVADVSPVSEAAVGCFSTTTTPVLTRVFWNWRVEWSHNFVSVLTSTELYALKRWLLCYANSISSKLLEEKREFSPKLGCTSRRSYSVLWESFLSSCTSVFRVLAHCSPRHRILVYVRERGCGAGALFQDLSLHPHFSSVKRAGLEDNLNGRRCALLRMTLSLHGHGSLCMFPSILSQEPCTATSRAQQFQPRSLAYSLRRTSVDVVSICRWEILNWERLWPQKQRHLTLILSSQVCHTSSTWGECF